MREKRVMVDVKVRFIPPSIEGCGNEKAFEALVPEDQIADLARLFGEGWTYERVVKKTPVTRQTFLVSGPGSRGEREVVVLTTAGKHLEVLRQVEPGATVISS